MVVERGWACRRSFGWVLGQWPNHFWQAGNPTFRLSSIRTIFGVLDCGHGAQHDLGRDIGRSSKLGNSMARETRGRGLSGGSNILYFA